MNECYDGGGGDYEGNQSTSTVEQVFQFMDDWGNAFMTADPIPNGSLPGLLIAAAYLDNTIGAISKGIGKAGKYITKVDDIAKLAEKTIPFTKSTLKNGQEMHKVYKADLADGITKIKEYKLPSGKRIDFIDFDTKTIYELKTYNPRSMKSGEKQLQQYLREVEKIYGDGWTTKLETY